MRHRPRKSQPVAPAATRSPDAGSIGRLGWRRVAVIFASALAVRLLHVWQMRDTPYLAALMGDSRGYDVWAQEIAAGDWIGRDVFYQAPLYPYFLGSLYALIGRDLLVIRLVQAVLGAVSCVALASAASRLVSRPAGLAAGLMLALYAPAIFFDGLLQKSVLDVLLVCLLLAVVARVTSRDEAKSAGADRWSSWIAMGVAAGGLTLTRENAAALVAVLIVWALTRARRGRIGRWTAAAGLVAGLALAIGPVVARNYAVSGGIYLTTSQFGSNLYIGNNPRAQGGYMSLRPGRGSPEFERVDASELAEQAMGRTLTPAEVSRYWLDRTLGFIVSDPAAWARLMARKAWLLMSATEVIDTESLESHVEYSWPLAVLAPVWHFGVLLPLAAAGSVLLWPRRHTLGVLYVLTAVYALSVIVFFVVARYRHPLVPLLMAFAAVGVVRLRDLAKERRRGLVAAAVVIVAILANWPAHTADSQRAITENNLGAALQEAGQTSAAIEHYRRALQLAPDYAPALNNLGTALRAAGRLDEAIATYDRALAVDGDRASVYVNRGNAQAADDRLGDAVDSFRQALQIDPRSSHARDALANALYDAGTAALERGALGEAVVHLEEAISVRETKAEAHNNLAIALASQGRLSDAIRHWERALELNPGLDDARKNLSLARR